MRHDRLLHAAAPEGRQRRRPRDAEDAVEDVGARGARRLVAHPDQQAFEVGMDEPGHHVSNAVDEVGRRRR